MAKSRTRLSLTVLALAGALAFSGCGANSDGASSSETSASQQVNDDAKNQIPDFMNKYFDAMRSGDAKDLSSDAVDMLTNKVKADQASSTEDVVKAIDEGLSSEEKQKLIDEMKNGADPIYNLIDHTDLNQAQDIMLSLAMVSGSESLFEQTATTDAEKLKVKVDLDKVTVDGNHASVPPSAMTNEIKESALATATATPSTDPEQDAANATPLVWNGSEWKIDGKKYYDMLAKNS